MAAACADAGRAAADVQLLAVSKTFDADAVREAAAAGQTAFGENYIQEAVAKIQALQGLGLVWHCIGPVQSNKSRLVAEHFDWVHTVDRLKLAERLSAQRPAHLPPLNVCIQANIDGGATKSGVAPADVAALAQAIVGLPGLRLRGLMTIPDIAPDFAAQCAVHTGARALFDAVKSGLSAGHAADFDTLSMGMSADLEAAIRCGSTLVRVGTAIFGGRVALGRCPLPVVIRGALWGHRGNCRTPRR